MLGDIYQFDARLDAGPPLAFDVALVSQGRLAAPVSGLALYAVTSATYLLAANGQGITLYDLLSAIPRGSGSASFPTTRSGRSPRPPASP